MNDTSRIVLHARDPSEQASSFGLLHQSYEQLSIGAFSGSLVAVSANDILVFQETLDQSVFQTGVSDAGYITIAAACELSDQGYWNGRHIDLDSVVAFTPGREFELRTPAHAVCFGVSLAPSLLRSISPEHPTDYWEKFFARNDCWSDAGRLRGDLQSRIARVLQDASAASAQAERAADLVELRELAIDYFGSLIERCSIGGHKLRVESYPRIARRARATMLERLSEPLSVTDLCTELGCSRRSLQYAFESIYGLGPVAYLRAMRLAEARRRLTGGKRGTTVQDVAAAVGFNHLPRFAQEYARMFGERPSASLAAHRAGGQS
ncbi:helix-turn-helix domain-containing protein [Rhodoferax koreense]|uniref:helix-turn-helix domain-containing protein n=1 Tax=Rhodoferax koreensis TaxID=1842727 RepID=UPI0012FF77A8|nr:helix-turn-helix domain-containing protein [Rhodoferax koreense]